MDERGDKRFLERREDRSYNIRTLWDKHREITRLKVLGKTNGEVAEIVGCTPQTVSNVCNSPIGRERLEVLSQRRDEDAIDVQKSIEEFAPVAERLLEEIISGGLPGASLALRAKYADRHLGRAGYGEVRKIQSVRATLTRADIDEIKARTISAARESGMVVDVEYEQNR